MAEIKIPFLTVKDETTGEVVQLSAIQDNNGNHVLRSVDENPRAYDDISDRIKVSHSNVEVIKLFENLEFRAGSPLVSQRIDVSMYKKIEVVITNNHDQTIRVCPLTEGGATREWNATTNLWEQISTLLPANAGGAGHVLSSRFPWIANSCFREFGLTIYIENSENPPTAGSLTAYIFGIRG